MHEGAEVSLRRLDEEMVVVWHENKGVKEDTVLPSSFRQIGEESLVIPTG